jgi:hypothetical protein
MGNKKYIGLLMSNYLNAAKCAHAALDTVSNSFCLTIWKQVSLHSSKFFKDYQHRRPNLDIMLREGFERKFVKEYQ